VKENIMWKFLEGKKTYIGLVVASIGMLAPVWGGVLGLSPETTAKIQEWFGPTGLVMALLGRILTIK
jgi:hypothetical protein